MCTPDFMDAMIPTPEEGGRVSDPTNRPNVNPFAVPAGRRTMLGRTGSKDREKGRKLDYLILRRSGMKEKEAKQLAAFAGHRGGLDTFDNIEAAKRAFSRSGAFTERARVPAATAQASRVSLASPTDETRVAATELIGLPLIRRG